MRVTSVTLDTEAAHIVDDLRSALAFAFRTKCARPYVGGIYICMHVFKTREYGLAAGGGGGGGD